MLSSAFSLLSESIYNASDVAGRIFTAVGNAQGAILAVFVIYTSYRFFLKPILGGAGSDRVSKSNPWQHYKVNESGSSNSKDITTR